MPERARWARLAAMSKSPEIGVEIDAAMRAIEESNESLKDALPKVFGRESLDRGIITGLIQLFSNMALEGEREQDAAHCGKADASPGASAMLRAWSLMTSDACCGRTPLTCSFCCSIVCGSNIRPTSR